MKIKKIITAILLLATCLTVTSCGPNYNEYEVGDLVYSIDNPDTENASAFVYELSESGKNKDVVYIPDEVDGMPVIGVGKIRMAIAQVSTFSSPNLGKIYFPWSIESDAVSINWYAPDMPKYIFVASTTCFIGQTGATHIFVAVSSMYLKLKERGLDVELANIAYNFNYLNNPNQGYFFIDLLEDSGKLTKPPYDPKREGYTFDGWYKERKCINKWDFENDIVTIEFDENGERIYEEVCLYAKWIEN